jgi:hypothetical protein
VEYRAHNFSVYAWNNAGDVDVSATIIGIGLAICFKKRSY